MNHTRFYINGGHYDNPCTDRIEDPGAVHGKYIEAKLTMALRDAIAVFLEGEDLDVEFVPDKYSLQKSIEFVNEDCEPGDIAIDLHFNSNKDPNVSGTEAYFHNNPDLARIFGRKVAFALGTRFRGHFPDTQSFIGSLGWLRKTHCKAVLIEVCYITNENDMKVLDMRQVARAIIKAMKEVEEKPDMKKEIQQKILSIKSLLVKIQESIWRKKKKKASSQ